jgi:hypothetical protein
MKILTLTSTAVPVLRHRYCNTRVLNLVLNLVDLVPAYLIQLQLPGIPAGTAVPLTQWHLAWHLAGALGFWNKLAVVGWGIFSGRAARARRARSYPPPPNSGAGKTQQQHPPPNNTELGPGI